MSSLPWPCVTALVALALSGPLILPAQAQSPATDMQARIDKLVPELESYVASGMKSFKVPGVAIGIVHDDKLVYTKGFGVKKIGKPDPVDRDTIFQVGSTTKAFFSTTLAQAVDAGKLSWNDRVADLLPEFQLSDPWIGRDFRVLDLGAQRSGLTAYINDGLSMLGYDTDTLIRSLREAPITATFRSDFTYTNITHIAGGEILAKKAGVESWQEVVQKGILDPLRMTSTTAMAEAIEKAANHATGHRPTEGDPVAVPFHPSFPYAFGPAGALNSNIPDMAQWLRLQMGRGQFEERILVSEKNLDVTWTPRVAMNERMSYAIGWVASATPNGRIIWHNGGTTGFGAHVGFLPDRSVGIVVLTNLVNSGFPDAVALWFYDRILGNATVDNVALALESARAREAEERRDRLQPKPNAASQDLAALAGTYTSPVLGETTLRAGDGVLRLKLEETDAMLTLTPLDTDLFNLTLDPEGAYAPVVAMSGEDPLTQVRFERDESGKVVRMRWLAPAMPMVLARQ